MSNYYEQLSCRNDYLKTLLSDITSKLESMPQGKLRISNSSGIPRYYHITDAKDTCGKYITKSNFQLAKLLAQKDYLIKLQKEAKAEMSSLQNHIKNITNLENIYEEINGYRKSLIIPWVLSDEEFRKQWEKNEYKTNSYFEEEKVYVTKNDERVRSKSEVMLADMYKEMDIPYRYEAELILENGKKRYPDFTLLDVKNRRVIYHEHFGLLDEEEYRLNCLAKMDEYRRNGIFPGKNLIITYEATGSYLNIKEVRKMIEEIMNCNI